MDPTFTIPYSEFTAIEELEKCLTRSEGYSFYIPASRQEKDIDFVLLKRSGNSLATCTFQVKGSRHYEISSGSLRKRAQAFYCSWFPRFRVSENVDFYLLVCPIPSHGPFSHYEAPKWKRVILCFPQAQMSEFIQNVKTRNGNPDKMFSFAYGEKESVIQIRGDQQKLFKDFSNFHFRYQVEGIKETASDRCKFHVRSARQGAGNIQ